MRSTSISRSHLPIGFRGSELVADSRSPSTIQRFPQPAFAFADLLRTPHAASFVVDRASTTEILRDMRRHVQRSKLLDEGCSVVALVCAERYSARAADVPDKIERRFTFGGAGSFRRTHADNEAVAILHQRMREIAKHRCRVAALLIETCVGIRR